VLADQRPHHCRDVQAVVDPAVVLPHKWQSQHIEHICHARDAALQDGGERQLYIDPALKVVC
jgi:hypothetical protein